MRVTVAILAGLVAAATASPFAAPNANRLSTLERRLSALERRQVPPPIGPDCADDDVRLSYLRICISL